jgi:hypothetical protein
MQIAYRARNTDDARSARDALAAAGITSHIPDQTQPASSEVGQLQVVPVLVDNRCLGAARRALELWMREHVRT